MFKTGKAYIPKDINEAYELAAEAKPALDIFSRTAAEAFGCEYIEAPLKGKERANQKLNGKYKGDLKQLQDIARGRIICDNLEQIDALKKHIKENTNPHAEVDRIDRPNERGYRDLKYTFPASNGLLVELQIHLRAFVEADKKTHSHYEKIRNITDGAKNRPLTDREQLEISFREKLCKKAYTDAVKSYNKDTTGRKIKTLPPLNITRTEIFNKLSQGKSL